MKEMIRYYGKDEVISQLTSATSLMSTAIEAGKHLFHLKDSDFFMLHRHTAKKELISVLKELMQLSSLKQFRLVGGTALSLQMGSLLL